MFLPIITDYQVKNTAVGLHSRWEKLLQRVSRRNNQLDENKRKSVIYSEKSSNFRDFVDETMHLIRSKRGKGDSRHSVLQNFFSQISRWQRQVKKG